MKRQNFKAIVCILCLVSSVMVKAQSSNQKNGPMIHLHSLEIAGHKGELTDDGELDFGLFFEDKNSNKGTIFVKNTGNEPLILTKPPRFIPPGMVLDGFPNQPIQPGEQAQISFQTFTKAVYYRRCQLCVFSNAINKPEIKTRVFRFSVVDKTDHMPVERNGKWGTIDCENKAVIPFDYEDIEKTYYIPDRYGRETVESVIIMAKKKGKWGRIDNKNIVMIPFVYDSIYSLSTLKEQRAALAKKNGKWGIIDGTNHILIPFEYDEIKPGLFRENSVSFNGGTMSAKKKGKWGLIDKNNHIVIPFEYESISDEGDLKKYGEVSAKKNGKVGIINADNRVVVPFEYDDILGFSGKDITRAKKNGKRGFIDRNNRVVIPFEYEDIHWSGFDEKGFVKVKKGGKWGVVDKNNKVIKPFVYDNEYDVYEKN